MQPGGSFYGELVRSELEVEEARRINLLQRGSSLLTASAAFATLLAGAIALGRGSASGRVPSSARVWLIITFAGFVAAGICALIMVRPASVGSPDIDGLRACVESSWEDEPSEAEQQVARTRVDELEKLVHRNACLASWLAGAIGCEIVGVVAAAVMAWKTVVA